MGVAVRGDRICDACWEIIEDPLDWPGTLDRRTSTSTHLTLSHSRVAAFRRTMGSDTGALQDQTEVNIRERSGRRKQIGRGSVWKMCRGAGASHTCQQVSFGPCQMRRAK